MTGDDTSFRVVAIHASDSPHLPTSCDGCGFVEVRPLFSVMDVSTGKHEHAEALGELAFKHGTMTGYGTILLPEAFVPDDAALGDEITARECYTAAIKSLNAAVGAIVEVMTETADAVLDAITAAAKAATTDSDEVSDP